MTGWRVHPVARVAGIFKDLAEFLLNLGWIDLRGIAQHRIPGGPCHFLVAVDGPDVAIIVGLCTLFRNDPLPADGCAHDAMFRMTAVMATGAADR